jgi:hypothetical protein
MTALGISWAFGLALCSDLSERAGPRVAAVLVAVSGGLTAALAGVVTGVVLAVPGIPLADPGPWLDAVPYGAALAALVLITPWASSRLGMTRVGACAGSVVALASALAVVEGLVGLQAPRPMLEQQVLIGCVMMAGAVAVAWSTAEAIPPDPSDPAADATRGAPVESAFHIPARGLVLPAVAALPAAAGLAGLFLPAVAVRLVGTLAGGGSFDATVVMPGLETLGGWTAIVAALALAVGALHVRLGDRRRAAVLFALAVGAGLAWLLLRTYPMHAWLPTMPPEIQQDLGTEYASLTVTALPSLASAAASAAAGAGALAGLAVLGWRRFAGPDEVTSDGARS